MSLINRYLLKYIPLMGTEKRWGGIDWINMARDRDQQQDLVNTVMDLWVP
jgi:hypothetical protein